MASLGAPPSSEGGLRELALVGSRCVPASLRAPPGGEGGLREVEGELALVGGRGGAPPGGEGGLREVEGELALVGGRDEAFPRLSERPLAARGGDYERWKESWPSLAAVTRRSRVSRSAPWWRGGDYERWKESWPSAAVARHSRISRSAPWQRGDYERWKDSWCSLAAAVLPRLLERPLAARWEGGDYESWPSLAAAVFPRLSERPLAARGGTTRGGRRAGPRWQPQCSCVSRSAPWRRGGTTRGGRRAGPRWRPWRGVPASLGAPPGGEGGLREVEGELALVSGRGEAFPRLSERPLAARGDYERWKESWPSLAAVARRSRVTSTLE